MQIFIRGTSDLNRHLLNLGWLCNSSRDWLRMQQLILTCHSQLLLILLQCQCGNMDLAILIRLFHSYSSISSIAHSFTSHFDGRSSNYSTHYPTREGRRECPPLKFLMAPQPKPQPIRRSKETGMEGWGLLSGPTHQAITLRRFIQQVSFAPFWANC